MAKNKYVWIVVKENDGIDDYESEVVGVHAGLESALMSVPDVEWGEFIPDHPEYGYATGYNKRGERWWATQWEVRG
jgi:hypothetical protein